MKNKDLEKKIEDLEKKIEDLEKKIEDLERRVNHMARGFNNMYPLLMDIKYEFLLRFPAQSGSIYYVQILLGIGLMMTSMAIFLHIIYHS